MFTGIVEELGRIKAIEPRAGGARLEIAATRVLADAAVGDSIAVNGCCLTVVERGDAWWAADAVTETLSRTNLGALSAGDPVNLERPVRMGERLDGHLVQGHIDGVGTVAVRESLPDGSTRFRVLADADLLRYVVEKGSIALDGISLTVTDVDEEGFGVAIIPHTLAVTTLGARQPGDRVNVEVDIVAKYVERLVAPHERS